MEQVELQKKKDALLTIEEVRKRLGYQHRQSVYELIKLGKLEAERFAAGTRFRWRVRESALQKYTDQYVIPDDLPLQTQEKELVAF